MQNFKAKRLKDLVRSKLFTVDIDTAEHGVWFNIVETKGKLVLFSNAVLCLGVIDELETTSSYCVVKKLERGLPFEFQIYFAKCTCFFSPGSAIEEIKYQFSTKH